MCAWKSNLSGSAAYLLSDMLSNTRHLLSKWSKSTFGHIQSRITQLQDNLLQLQAQDTHGNNIEEVIQLEK